MPVIPQKPEAVLPDQDQLVDRLARELSHEGEVGEPLVFENPIGTTEKFFAIVVWSEWRFIPVRQRASIILEAYRKYDQAHPEHPKASNLAMPTGMTWEEADAKGLFPYSITPNVHPDEIDPQLIRDAMLGEGALTTASGIKLRFATRESAQQAFQRLQEKLPQAYWSLNQIVTRIEDE